MEKPSVSLVSLLLVAVSLLGCALAARAQRTVVADSVTRLSLPSASVFDRDGRFAGISRADGRLPYVSPAAYPLTIRYIGYKEKVVPMTGNDTIFMQELSRELSEVVVESRSHKVLHMLAYVREYSTLTTYTDTVSLFREKMVDYMLPEGDTGSFKGWSNPRVLASKSYYRFTDAKGLDSVSDRCNHHFSWADWMWARVDVTLPGALRGVEVASDTVNGRYQPAEIWVRNGSRVVVDVDVMADARSRRWVPGLLPFFRKDVDFEQVRVRFDYDNVAQDSVMPADLAGYSFDIESNGRGHGMFMFNRVDQPYCVSTYGEVDVIDKEYVTVTEARKWEKRQMSGRDIAIFEPAEAPALQPAVVELVDRVNSIDRDEVKLAIAPDRRLIGREVEKLTFEKAVLQRLKGILGISQLRGRWKQNRHWREFREEMRERNQRQMEDDDGSHGM